jgi:peptidoglycan/LPS O-acetylase OafA/YrhL
MNTTRPYITTLTPLRGIAALLVLIFHSNLMVMPFNSRNVNFMSGWLWVDFFFVLSGFIIFYVYGESFKESLTTASYWKYIKARFARVYPLHFFTLVWCLICAIVIIHNANGIHPFFGDMFGPFGAIPSLLFIQSLGLYTGVPLNTPSWSLSTEWWVYMIFPLMVPFFTHLKRLGMILTTLFIIAFFVFIKYFLGPISGPFTDGPPTLNVLTDFGIFRCLAGFLAGMLLFRMYEEGIAYRFFKQSWVFVVFFVGVIFAMAMEVEDILIVAFFPFIILSAAYNNTSIKKMLDTTVLQKLGDWSFSIYMVHVPIMYLIWIYMVRINPEMFATFPPPPPDPATYPLAFMVCVGIVVVTLLVASFTYRYVEVPARDYLNRKQKSKVLEPVKVVR